MKRDNPTVKDILYFIGKGVLLSSAFMIPGASKGLLSIYKEYEKWGKRNDARVWDRYDLTRLHFALARLHKQKMVEVTEKNGISIVRLTKKGKLKTLRYHLEDMAIGKPAKWDGKWRLIIYDVHTFKRNQQTAFRRMLKHLGFLQIQKSVYLSPYPCGDEIQFLREYFDIGNEVLYILVEHIEQEDAYKPYFGLS